MITCYSTYFSIPARKNWDICESPLINILVFVNKHLTEWDKDFQTNRWLPTYRYCSFDHVRMEMHFPLHFISHLIEYIKDAHGTYEIRNAEANPTLTANLRLSNHFQVRDDQVDPIKFLSNPTGSMSALELGCGIGKTFTAINALAKHNVKALVVCPANIFNQWNTSLNLHLKTPKIYHIQGANSVFRLIKANYESSADIYLASIKTLSQYAQSKSHYKDIDPMGEFFRQLGVGVKVTDECHLNFWSSTLIDLAVNVKYNFYLSATYDRSSATSDRIFKKALPNDIKFDAPDDENYVNITEVEYYTGGLIKDFHVSNKRGYNQYKYEQYLMKYPDRQYKVVHHVLKPIINQYFIRIKEPKQKLLILVGLKNFANWLKEEFRVLYPNLTINSYLGGDSDDLLETSDVIISTIGSFGVGKDCPNLRTTIMFTSIRSEPQSMQVLGRLRKLNGVSPEFVYMRNTGVSFHKFHSQNRERLYRPKAKVFRKIAL